jgi:hypothetical protein
MLHTPSDCSFWQGHAGTVSAIRKVMERRRKLASEGGAPAPPAAAEALEDKEVPQQTTQEREAAEFEAAAAAEAEAQRAARKARKRANQKAKKREGMQQATADAAAEEKRLSWERDGAEERRADALLAERALAQLSFEAARREAQVGFSGRKAKLYHPTTHTHRSCTSPASLPPPHHTLLAGRGGEGGRRELKA